MSEIPDGWITTTEASVRSGFREDYVSELCRTGRVSAIKTHRWWLDPRTMPKRDRLRGNKGVFVNSRIPILDDYIRETQALIDSYTAALGSSSPNIQQAAEARLSEMKKNLKMYRNELEKRQKC